MKGNGKYLEKLVSLIEEVIKEYEFIKVNHNQYKFDKNGRKRQIDVLVESDWGRLGRQFVIIECKDWARPVEISDVESFITKVENLSATKGIIVSSRGFQKGAIETAKGAQRVELYLLDELNEIKIEESLEIPVIKIGYQITNDKIDTFINCRVRSDDTTNYSKFDGSIYLDDKLIASSVLDFSMLMIRQFQPQFLRKISEVKVELEKPGVKTTPAKCQLSIKYVDPFYFQAQGEKLKINSLELAFTADLFKEKTDSIKLRSYKALNSSFESEVVSVDFSESTLEMISNTAGEKRYFEVSKKGTEIYEYYKID